MKIAFCLLLAGYLGLIVNAQQQGSLRLVNGSSSSEGRLEVYINGQWGTVCDDSWSYSDASVACRQLGYARVSDYDISISSGSSSQRIWLDDVGCSGNESKLIYCRHRGYGVHNCGHHEDVGIRCLSSRAVRLVGGSTSYEGRVEVYYSGQWRSVCSTSSSFATDEATTVCRQLGYSVATRRTTTYYRSSSSTVSVSCYGIQSSLSRCSVSTAYCSGSYRQYIECSNLDVRLVGGSTSSEGRVEVYYSGQWRSVCGTSSSFATDEATTVCRDLGYNRLVSRTTIYYGSRSGAAYISCSGSQSSVIQCSIGTSSCSSSRRGQYVVCGNSSTLDQNSNGDARLVGGRSQYEGRVEVYYNGQWQTVCNSYRTFQNVGDVVCGQLGYGLVSGMRADYRTTSSDSVSVSCSGGQSSLRECSFTEAGTCYTTVRVLCSNSNVYAPLVWTVLIPLVCGLVVLCILCLPCCVACHLYRKKNSVVPSAPRHTSDDGTVTYNIATESQEQARVEYPTLSPPNFYNEVGDHSNARVDQNNSNPGQQMGVDIPVYETAPDGTQLQDSPPEWTANPNLVPPTAEYCTLQTAADDREPHTVSQQLPVTVVNTDTAGSGPHDSPPMWIVYPTSDHEVPTGEFSTLQSATDEPLTEGHSTLQNAGEYEQPFFSEEVTPINNATVVENPHCE